MLAEKEQHIQNNILQYLQFREDIVFAMRVNAGRIKTERGGLVKLAPSGTADIIGMLKGGKFFAIEVKTPKAIKKKDHNLSEFQKEFLEKIDNGGGLAMVVSSIEEVEKIFKK